MIQTWLGRLRLRNVNAVKFRGHIPLDCRQKLLRMWQGEELLDHLPDRYEALEECAGRIYFCKGHLKTALWATDRGDRVEFERAREIIMQRLRTREIAMQRLRPRIDSDENSRGVLCYEPERQIPRSVDG